MRPELSVSRRAATLLLASSPALLLRPGAAPAAELGDLQPNGLRFFDFLEGQGPTPRYGQLLRFHYVGYTASKARDELIAFDSTYDRGSPYFVKHGNGLTCQGIEEALHTMRRGGRRRVILTPQLGFTADKGPIPPRSGPRETMFKAVTDQAPLIFDLELVSIMDDLLDRGDYEDLTVEEYAQQQRQREAAEAEAAAAAETRAPARGGSRRRP